jgi:hypothetical protein
VYIYIVYIYIFIYWQNCPSFRCIPRQSHHTSCVYYILPLQLPGGHVELADLSSMEEVSGCVHPEACCGLPRRCGPWWPGQNDRIWLANMLGWVGSCGFRAGKRPGRTWLIYTYVYIISLYHSLSPSPSSWCCFAGVLLRWWFSTTWSQVLL